MSKKVPISKFESLAQSLIEGSLGRLLGGSVTPADMAARLSRVFEDSQIDGVVADRYTIYLTADNYQEICATYPQLEDELQSLLLKLSRQTGLTMRREPFVQLAADNALKNHEIRLEAARQSSLGDTTQLQVQESEATAVLAAISELDAYLVADGRHHISLTKPIINIGRRTDNDIVLEAATISRRHAQLRWRYGRFILYDLSNRDGRTKVNGQPVTECVLQAGDIISLSNVKLLYAEEKTIPKRGARRQEAETQLMPRVNREDEV